jgi:hypothetical protein
VDTEEAERGPIEEINARCNQLKKVAVQDLTASHTRRPNEEQNLVIMRNKGRSGKQKSSQVEEDQRSRD